MVSKAEVRRKGGREGREHAMKGREESDRRKCERKKGAERWKELRERGLLNLSK
jgi:hypothetical protein